MVDGQGCGASTEHRRQPGVVDRRVRRSSPRRRRRQPAFYRDSSSRGDAAVDADEWVWMSTYSKIPVSSFHRGRGVKFELLELYYRLELYELYCK